MVEARSCERFTRLLEVVEDPEVEHLLADLGPAERRHWQLFHQLAGREVDAGGSRTASRAGASSRPISRAASGSRPRSTAEPSVPYSPSTFPISGLPGPASVRVASASPPLWAVSQRKTLLA